jgi:hypothetical protein
MELLRNILEKRIKRLSTSWTYYDFVWQDFYDGVIGREVDFPFTFGLEDPQYKSRILPQC